MAKFRTVKVVRPVVADMDPETWIAYDRAQEHVWQFEPDEWICEAMGARSCCWVRAVWSIDGWQWRRRLRRPGWLGLP